MNGLEMDTMSAVRSHGTYSITLGEPIPPTRISGMLSAGLRASA